METLKTLTNKQTALLNLVRANPGQTTAALRRLNGDRQAYETNLRDRLFRLAERGLIRFDEKLGKNDLIVVERRWF